MIVAEFVNHTTSVLQYYCTIHRNYVPVAKFDDNTFILHGIAVATSYMLSPLQYWTKIQIYITILQFLIHPPHGCLRLASENDGIASKFKSLFQSRIVLQHDRLLQHLDRPLLQNICTF